MRIKEREEAIQLLAMDPQVCGKLLTLHQKGNRVDVEALSDRIPLRQGAGKVPRWDLTGTEGCGGGKVFPWMPLVVWGYLGIYRQKNQVRRVKGGPQGWGRTLHPCRCLVAPPTSSPSLMFVLWSKKNHRGRFHSVWTPFGIPFLQNSKTRKKEELALGSRLIGQSQK